MNFPSDKISQANLVVLAGLILATLTAAPPVLAQAETVLYNFCSVASCADGSTPESGLVSDAAGNLYGTTYFGGANNVGTVFKLSPKRGALNVLHSFLASSQDGAQPSGELAIDASGNLYGTTVTGGANGSGTVFEISQSAETILHNFGGTSSDGLYPAGGLTMDAAGNLYGTSPYGGKGYGSGTVFTVSAQGTYSVLYAFLGSPDALRPVAPVFVDQAGNLYGTTAYGGTYGEGAVYKVSPQGKETVLHSFSAIAIENGVFPHGGLVSDSAGNLYGTTYDGGAFHTGVVFKLTPAGSYSVVHNFGGSGDGLHTNQGLIIDGQGNLYGTCFQGGAQGYGIVFKLAADGTETILHSFGFYDGAYPQGMLFMDSLGNLYGTTEEGGSGNSGTVYKVTP
jgi:uncharacterized repeat protein (TIGR03803 family)